MIDAAGTGHCIVEPIGVSGQFDADMNCDTAVLVVCSTARKLDEAMDW